MQNQARGLRLNARLAGSRVETDTCTMENGAWDKAAFDTR
jgi:hypothetical protein